MRFFKFNTKLYIDFFPQYEHFLSFLSSTSDRNLIVAVGHDEGAGGAGQVTAASLSV